jgi:hypothetical protein
LAVLKLYEEYLLDIKTTSQTRVTRPAKIARDIGFRSTKTAQKTNDPLHKRMEYHRKLYKAFKHQIMTKYASRVKSQARR